MPAVAGASVPLLRTRVMELARIAFAEALRQSADPDPERQARITEAVGEMASAIARAAALADVRARSALLHEAGVSSDQRQIVGVLGNRDDFVTMPFDEAVNELINLTPIDARNADDVVNAYARREFALRQDIALEVTRVAQRTAARLLQTGGTVDDFIEAARGFEGGHFTDNYAETVFRTEVTRAQTAGRIEQSRSPELRGFIVAYRYNAVGDARTRPNHLALDRHMFAVDHPAWRTISPPNGWNCRCRLFMVTRRDAQRLGRLDDEGNFVSDQFPVAGGQPDEGFAQSPAVEVYGS